MATITCDDCTESEVWTKIGTAVDGDTVVLPAGNEHWSSQHILTKAIKLEGAGIDTTIIQNDFSGGFWIRFDLVVGAATEITGITFKNGTSTGSGSIDANSVLRFIGDNTSSYQLRVHHCKFDQLNQWPVFTSQVRGVFDHNVFSRCDGGGAYTYALDWKADPEPGTPSSFGDGSWASPTNAGGDDAIYFEDNFFDQTGGAPDKTFFDGTRGGRLVVRYNTFTQIAGNNAAIVTCHGLEGRNRSIRHVEFYANYITSMTSTMLSNNRGGTGLLFNNRVGSGTASPIMKWQADRQGDLLFWGRASGTNPVDVNDTSAGPGPNDNPTPFYTGVMGTGTTTNSIKVVPSPGWTPDNKWVGYSVSDTSRPVSFTGYKYCPEQQYAGGVITASTADTLTIAAAVFGFDHAFASGDSFRINRVLHAMDMTGRAGVDTDSLVTGGATVPNPTVLPVGWNNQDTEPYYEWNNIRLPSTDIAFANATTPYIRSGVHFFNETIMPGYPWTDDVSSRCGAEDFTNVTLTGAETNGGSGGFTYPHPLTTGAAGKIINLPATLPFGNVIIGEAPTLTITCSNLGDTLLTVTSVAYSNAKFTGSTAGFTVAAGASHDVVVTYTPTTETLDTCTITFNSDADSGTETVAATGTGVAPAGGGGRGKGHKKGVLVGRGR